MCRGNFQGHQRHITEAVHTQEANARINVKVSEQGKCDGRASDKEDMNADRIIHMCEETSHTRPCTHIAVHGCPANNPGVNPHTWKLMVVM